MIRLLYFGLLGQLLVSCINMNEPEDQATYIEALKKYDKSLLKLFPDRLPNNMFGYGITQPYDNVQGGLNLTLKYFSQGEYIREKAKYSKQSKFDTNSADNCFFIIDDYESLIKERCDNFYPIPTDAIFETNPYYNSKTRLVDSDLYFIDFKPGDYIKDYKRHSRLELPENWAHGYSTGVTANDNDRTIQLWLVVW